MNTKQVTHARKQLVWSEDGQIGCRISTHAPFEGSDTWRRERWRPMTRVEWVDFAAEVGREPRCESCAAIARAAERAAS